MEKGNDVFDEIYSRIIAEDTRLNTHWKIFRQLFTESDKRMTLLNSVAPGYFYINLNSLVDSVVLTICRLTDPARSGNKDNLSLPRLISELNSKLPDIQIQEIQSRLDEIIRKMSPIRDYRNKRLSHNDLDSALGKNNILPIPRKLIDDLINDINEIVIILKREIEEVHYIADNPIFEGDAEDLVFYLKRGYEATRKYNQ